VSILHGDDVILAQSVNSTDFNAFKPRLATLLSKQFIKVARSISIDEQVNREQHIKAVALVAGSAEMALKKMMAPNQFNHLRQVIVTSLLLKSRNSMAIRWVEIERDRHSGQEITRTHLSGELSFQFKPPSKDVVLLKQNPLGFYITNLVWAHDFATRKGV